MKLSFNVRRAAQISAFFCEKAGGQIPLVKLVKLIYLGDRESMSQTGFPITDDQFVSMPHGPVNSMILNFINGAIENEAWSDLISDRADHDVGLARSRNDDDIDELSQLDLEVLEKVWIQFGKMSKWEIRDWTHDHCPEWEDPAGSCNPIPYARVLKYLQVEQADQVAADVISYQKVDRLFSDLRA
jgi:uncharacterized phage-associated protein